MHSISTLFYDNIYNNIFYKNMRWYILLSLYTYLFLYTYSITWSRPANVPLFHIGNISLSHSLHHLLRAFLVAHCAYYDPPIHTVIRHIISHHRRAFKLIESKRFTCYNFRMLMRISRALIYIQRIIITEQFYIHACYHYDEGG